MKQYIHSVPGRLRVKTALIKKNEETALHTRKFIGQIRGVKSVATNTITGSITILYDTKIVKNNTLLDILKESNFISDQKTTPQIDKTLSRLVEFTGKFLLGLAVEKTFGYNFLSFVITSIIFF
jgi:copper chaperone CopZ